MPDIYGMTDVDGVRNIYRAPDNCLTGKTDIYRMTNIYCMPDIYGMTDVDRVRDVDGIANADGISDCDGVADVDPVPNTDAIADADGIADSLWVAYLRRHADSCRLPYGDWIYIKIGRLVFIHGSVRKRCGANTQNDEKCDEAFCHMLLLDIHGADEVCFDDKARALPREDVARRECELGACGR